MNDNLPLSKCLDPRDYAELAEELKTVDRYFTSAREQHPARRWEYAMALRAQQAWYDQTDAARPRGPVVDVGGAGSPFWKMINLEVCRVVDPEEGCDLAEHLRLGARLASEVYCLSVLEHVDDLDRFCYHLACLVAPGGLLFLSFDTCGCRNHYPDPERHHFHWMRQRIFDETARAILPTVFQPYGFSPLGEIDPAYHGAQVYDYSFGTVALVRAR